MRRINSWTALVVGSALVLAGCGGDDDGSGPDVQLTAITAENAAPVSAVVYQAASVLFDVAASSGTLPLGAVVQSAPGRSGGLGLASFAARQIKAAVRRPPAAGTGVVAAVYEETFQCAGGGSVTERRNDADDNGVESVGDGLRLTFVNCVEEGVTSNGVLAWNLTLLSEASIGAKVTFDNFALNDGTDTIEADGGFDLSFTEKAGVSELYEIAGETLASTLNGDRHTITGFTGSAASDYAAATVTYVFKGRVSDSSNNISVDAETVTPFVAQTADDFPGSGTLRSIGAGDSQALLEAVSATLVLISVDPEGDGSFTAPVEWSWSALDALPD
jgi:predicted small secreted protein